MPTPEELATEDPAGATRLYRGTRGTAPFDVALTRDGARLEGTCNYGQGRGSTLDGQVGDGGALVLHERHVEKASEPPVATGTFELQRDGKGGLNGTWTDARGAKKLPVALAPRGVSPAPRKVYLGFLARYGRFLKKTPLTQAELDTIQGGDRFVVPTTPGAPQPLADRGVPDRASLYVTDIDNDGTLDFVLVSESGMAENANELTSVYDADGDSLRDLDLHGALAKVMRDGGQPTHPLAAYRRGTPFLEITPKGTVFRLYDVVALDKEGHVEDLSLLGHPDRLLERRVVLLWKNGAIEEVEHTETVVPVNRPALYPLPPPQPIGD